MMRRVSTYDAVVEHYSVNREPSDDEKCKDCKEYGDANRYVHKTTRFGMESCSVKNPHR